MDATDALFVSCRPSNAPPLKVTDTPMRSKAYLDSARRICTDDRQQDSRTRKIAPPSSGKLSKYDAITTVHRADTEQTTLSRVVTDVIVERQDIWYIKPTVFAFHRRLRTGSLNNRLGASDV